MPVEAASLEMAPAGGQPALSLLDFVPVALRTDIRERRRTEPVHEAVQSWLDAIAETRRPGHIPAGRYGLAARVTWSEAGDSQGPILIGDGSSASVFTPVEFDGGPLFRFDGSSLRPYKHALHMRLVDFGIVAGDNVTDGGATGIELIGMLYADIERLGIVGLGEDAFFVPARPDIDANPDAYTSQVAMRSVHVDGCGGWAVRSTAGFGLNLRIEDPYFVRNRAGGVFQGGGQFRCERGTVSYNGSADALRRFAEDPSRGAELGGGGICIAETGGGTIGARIVQTELDANYAYNLWCQAGMGIVTEQVKSNSSGIVRRDGVLRPPRHFVFGFKNGNVVNYRSVNDAFRTKALATEPDTPVLAFAWDSTPGIGKIGGHVILNPYFHDVGGAGVLTRYSDTRPDERVTIIENNRPVRETPEAIVSRVITAQTLPAAAVTPIRFDRDEFDPLNLLDGVSGTFRPASEGLYEVQAIVHLEMPDAGFIRLFVYVDGGPHAEVLRSLAPGRQTVDIQTMLPLAAGAELTLRAAHDLAEGIEVVPGIHINRLTVRKVT